MPPLSSFALSAIDILNAQNTVWTIIPKASDPVKLRMPPSDKPGKKNQLTEYSIMQAYAYNSISFLVTVDKSIASCILIAIILTGFQTTNYSLFSSNLPCKLSIKG